MKVLTIVMVFLSASLYWGSVPMHSQSSFVTSSANCKAYCGEGYLQFLVTCEELSGLNANFQVLCDCFGSYQDKSCRVSCTHAPTVDDYCIPEYFL